MPEEIISPFPYDVPGIGTVIDHESDGYVVRVPSGSVYGYKAPGGTPTVEHAAADIAFAIAHPPAFPENQAAIYAAQVAPGYLDALTGIRLKTTDAAQIKFTAAMALIRLAVEQGFATNSDPFVIWDYDNASHTLTIADFKALVLRYGLFCQQLFNEYAP